MKIDTKITISLTKQQVEDIVVEYLKQQGTIRGEVSYKESKIAVKSMGYGPGEYSFHEFNGMDIVVSG